MPRYAPIGSCITCRRRKVKCDGQLPTCRNCAKGGRLCQRETGELKFIIHTPDPSSFQQPSHIEPSSDELDHRQQPESPPALNSESLSSFVYSEPKLALQDPYVASLFHHYIDVLAPWYDLCDSESTFGNIVPQNALQNAVLFKALISFAAYHNSSVSGRMKGFGEAFHAACVQDLLEIISSEQTGGRGDFLAATCLLRSYEILAGDSRRKQQHLLGAYVFSTKEPIDMTVNGLSQAGFWNYLREEITVSLECQRVARIGFPCTFDCADNFSDSMRANIISHILARIINHSFSEQNSAEETERSWKNLKREFMNWQNHLPATFEPYSTAPKDNNPFPSFWYLQPWHIAAQQYASVSLILLEMYNPMSPPNQISVHHHAIKICGIAYTNDNLAARVNAFGPIAFCARYLVEALHRDTVKNMLHEFAGPTAWPVGCIIEDLERVWDSA